MAAGIALRYKTGPRLDTSTGTPGGPSGAGTCPDGGTCDVASWVGGPTLNPSARMAQGRPGAAAASAHDANAFLGVITDFSRLEREGIVELGVSPRRKEKLDALCALALVSLSPQVRLRRRRCSRAR